MDLARHNYVVSVLRYTQHYDFAFSPHISLFTIFVTRTRGGVSTFSLSPFGIEG